MFFVFRFFFIHFLELNLFICTTNDTWPYTINTHIIDNNDDDDDNQSINRSDFIIINIIIQILPLNHIPSTSTFTHTHTHTNTITPFCKAKHYLPIYLSMNVFFLKPAKSAKNNKKKQNFCCFFSKFFVNK